MLEDRNVSHDTENGEVDGCVENLNAGQAMGIPHTISGL